MADSHAFGVVCDALENATSLDRLEARGTVRIALKSAGLDARTVNASQLRVVIEKVLPDELKSRGVDPGVSSILAGSLEGVADETGGADGPEAVFRRLGG